VNFCAREQLSSVLALRPVPDLENGSRHAAAVRPSSAMKISLIIPAYNEEQLIGSCLQSVAKHGVDQFSEIIVIDNASSDRTAEIAGSFPGVRVVRETRKGLSYARQRGLETATGDLLAFVDADTRLPAGWAHMVQEEFGRSSEIVCFSGRYSYYDGSFFLRTLLNIFWWLSAPLAYQLVGYMVVGGNFVARRTALEVIGGFDLKILFYGEDTDIARRLSSTGRVVFRMRFHNSTSTRRFVKEGLIVTSARYAINFIWPVIFHRPFSRSYFDVRSEAPPAHQHYSSISALATLMVRTLKRMRFKSLTVHGLRQQ
jgi:glycosyltransferase involved in cell wall biosynthesis